MYLTNEYNQKWNYVIIYLFQTCWVIFWRYLEKKVVTNSHSIFYTYYRFQWLPVSNILQMIFFFVEQKIETRKSLKSVEDE